MAFIEKFSEDEQAIIVSLPYRAGIWISKADDAGETASGEQEREALEKIIEKKSSGMFETAFIHEIMAESFARKSAWSSWDVSSASLEDDCTMAINAIVRVLGEREVGAYRKSIMDIAGSVAQAFREFEASTSFLSRLLPRSANVSYKESSALARLSGFLGIKKT